MKRQNSLAEKKSRFWWLIPEMFGSVKMYDIEMFPKQEWSVYQE